MGLEESTYYPTPQTDNRIQRQMKQVTAMNMSSNMVGRIVDSSPADTLGRVRRIAKSHDVHITSLETEVGNKDPISCLIWQDEKDDSRKVFIFCNNEGEDEILVLHARVDFEPPIYGPIGEVSDTGYSELFEGLMRGRTRFDPEIEDSGLTSVSLFQVFPVCASNDTLSLLLEDSVEEILATADNVRTTISQTRWQDEMR